MRWTIAVLVAGALAGSSCGTAMVTRIEEDAVSDTTVLTPDRPAAEATSATVPITPAPAQTPASALVGETAEANPLDAGSAKSDSTDTDTPDTDAPDTDPADTGVGAGGAAVAAAIPAATQPTPAPDEQRSVAEPLIDNIVATATDGSIDIHDGPGGSVVQALANPTETGAPLVFLVREARDDWLDVYLPIRPNGSTGWVRAGDVDLSRHDYRIEVRLQDHRMTVFDGDDTLLDTAVAVGTQDTPTPGGIFYVKELLDPPAPNGPYGSFAYGLSGYSNVLDSFAGGDGVVGIHGTNNPASIGTDVSHGCIRITNEDIEFLAGVLPLGTPVEILP